jgi:hypothetical protein
MSMKHHHPRFRYHFRLRRPAPQPTRSQIRNSIRGFEIALAALRTEVAFELTRPEPSAERLRWMQERADKLLDLIAGKEACL